MIKSAIKLTPRDHGRRMTLEEFDHAEVEEGMLYELGRGTIIVSEVPSKPHMYMVVAIRRQILGYDVLHPGRIHAILAGNECKIPVSGAQSERHPDVAAYNTEPPTGSDYSHAWIPELVIEVVSPGSEQRDYVEKREEYLQFGVKEYWIVDAAKQQMLVLHRSRGQWAEQTVAPPAIYSSPLLPGFDFNCGLVFDAARLVK
ncbi:MAG TPA: Uma2 family endonuclease [Planctomycetota bacterium]|nr:Uma2 family endonuclease [Planctomycetota bacterium]